MSPLVQLLVQLTLAASGQPMPAPFAAQAPPALPANDATPDLLAEDLVVLRTPPSVRVSLEPGWLTPEVAASVAWKQPPPKADKAPTWLFTPDMPTPLPINLVPIALERPPDFENLRYVAPASNALSTIGFLFDLLDGKQVVRQLIFRPLALLQGKH